MKKLLVLACITLLVTPALADDYLPVDVHIDSPEFVCPGGPYTIAFYVYNNSPDVEWISQMDFCFNPCFEILGGSYLPDEGYVWDFNVVVDPPCIYFMDANGGWGEVYDYSGGFFYVDVMVNCECEMEYPIDWYAWGDIYGDPPHEDFGTVFLFVSCVTPTQSTTWSTVKGLY